VYNTRAIEQQLVRLSESASFRNCPRLLRFLRFVVNEALSGAGGSKERLIGMEVFGRPSDYDAGADPVVRVEARRLRRKLEEYYAGPGAADALIIELPKGTYLPCFTERSFHSQHSLAVLPFSGHLLCEGLTSRLIARLAACEFLRVFHPKHAEAGSPADLILEGSLRQAGERFRCDSQLVSSTDGLHVWAGSFDCCGCDPFAMEDEFAGRIAEGVREAFRSGSPTMKA
jgi:TolB-like protein